MSKFREVSVDDAIHVVREGGMVRGGHDLSVVYANRTPRWEHEYDLAALLLHRTNFGADYPCIVISEPPPKKLSDEELIAGLHTRMAANREEADREKYVIGVHSYAMGMSDAYEIAAAAIKNRTF